MVYAPYNVRFSLMNVEKNNRMTGERTSCALVARCLNGTRKDKWLPEMPGA